MKKQVHDKLGDVATVRSLRAHGKKITIPIFVFYNVLARTNRACSVAGQIL